MSDTAPTPELAWADPARQAAFHQWLDSVAPAHGLDPATVRLASADASFRRYLRVDGERGSRIVMDAPPDKEDCRPFVKVAQLMAGAGLNAPRVLEWDEPRGFMLLDDLGTRTMIEAVDRERASANKDLYLRAVDALVAWQLASRPDALPPYDEALLRRELDLFPDWYIARHLGITLTAAQRDVLERAFRLVLDNNLAQPRVYVHRDYHSRNLMITAPNPGLLDFQDAVHGPITYDLVSLLRDAYIAWDEEKQIDWAVRYWERARKARLPVDADFGAIWRDFEWMGVQRQIKVLGIFARLAHRDGKRGYIDDMPLVMKYLRGACGRYRDLSPMIVLLDAFEGHAPAVGYTF